MPPDTDTDLARRAYELSVRTDEALKSHLQSCEQRSRQLIDLVNARHEVLAGDIRNLASQNSTMQKVAISIGGALILGLFSIVGVLLHNGGHF